MTARSLAFSSPLGGLHLWCRLQHGVTSSQLLRLALSKGVSLVNGEVFYAYGGAGRQEVRLCFTYIPTAKIELGIKRLADAVRVAESDASRRQSYVVPIV